MTTTGINTLKDVTKAKVSNTGDLSLSGTNNLVNISGTFGTTEVTGGTFTNEAQITGAVDNGGILTSSVENKTIKPDVINTNKAEKVELKQNEVISKPVNSAQTDSGRTVVKQFKAKPQKKKKLFDISAIFDKLIKNC